MKVGNASRSEGSRPLKGEELGLLLERERRTMVPLEAERWKAQVWMMLTK